MLQIYTAVKLLGKKSSSRSVARLVETSDRTVQRYLKILVDNGYVEPVRRGMRVYYHILKPITRYEAEQLVAGRVERDAPVYELARSIESVINEFGVKADFVGAAKIHLSVPRHTRITHDVDLVVVEEHASTFIKLLEYIHSLLLETRGGIHADYRLSHPLKDVKVDVMIGGFKEGGRVVWHISDFLRKKGKLTLEHAVIAKLTRRNFDTRTDAYDIAVSLPFIDLHKFREILRELKNENLKLLERIPPHLRTVHLYIKREYSSREAEMLEKLLSELQNQIRDLIST